MAPIRPEAQDMKRKLDELANQNWACSRQTLAEQIQARRYQAEKEACNLQALVELQDLMEANPAVSRILELIRQLEIY